MTYDLGSLAEITTARVSQSLSYRGAVAVEYDIAYPVFENPSAAFRPVNTFYLEQCAILERRIRSSMFFEATRQMDKCGGGGFAPFSVDCGCEIMYNRGGIVSIFSDTYETLGAKGERRGRMAQTWLAGSARQLSLSYFFSGRRWESIIREEVSGELWRRQSLNDGCIFADWKRRLPGLISRAGFYLGDDGVVIFLQPHEIGAKSMGIPSFLIPYRRFGSEIKIGL